MEVFPMPLSRITTNFSLEEETNRFVDDFHDVMQRTLKLPEYDRMVILDQVETGFFLPTNISGKYILFELTLFEGRKGETKRQLYKRLAELAVAYGVDRFNTRIIVYEVGRENWGIRGGQAASEVDLGFRTDV
jgi:phenylpyruvate tautomerase PptA (4-oxalocrotonate tautomerase family)